MRKKIWAFTVFLFFFYSFDINRVNGQVFHLPPAVERIVTGYCSVCKKNMLDSNKQMQLQDGFSSTDLAYHNAIFFLQKGDVDNCYQCLNACINRKPEIKDSLFNITSFLKAKILYYKSLYKEAVQIYIPLLDNSNLDQVFKENICTNVAEIYLEQSNFTKSLQYFAVWNTDYKTFSNTNSIKIAYCNIGLCYLHTNQFEKASKYFDESVIIAKQSKDTSGLAILYENIANQYYNQYLDNKALTYFLQSLFFAKHSGNTEAQMNIYGSLSVVEENRNHFRKALDYLKQYVALNDSLFKRDNIYDLIEKEKNLAIKEKDQQVQIVKQANQLQSLKLTKSNLELSKQRQLLYLLIVLVITFLSFFIFAFNAYQQKNKQNKIISAQREELDALNQTKDQLFSVVAHDLRSPVQTLKITLTKLRTALSDNNISIAEKIAGEIENISNGTYSLLNNLLYWALSQAGQLHFTNDKLNIKRLVEQVFCDYIPVAATKNITLENCVSESLYCTGDMNTIKIILRNLVDNAIKFSPSSAPVVISGSEENEECIVSVTDDGKGIDAAIVQALDNKSTKRVNSTHTQGQQSTGIGLWLVKTMAERNGGSLHIEQRTRGTSMNIHLPQYRNYEQIQNTYC